MHLKKNVNTCILILLMHSGAVYVITNLIKTRKMFQTFGWLLQKLSFASACHVILKVNCSWTLSTCIQSLELLCDNVLCKRRI